MSTTIHDTFQVDQWWGRVGRFAPDNWGNRGLGAIIGPRHACMLVDLRHRVRRHLTFGEPQPTDLFLLGLGDPPSRDTTKIGGLPFWPRSRSWPHSDAQVPLPFLAQFTFRDSQDIVGDLPADLLLLFGQKNDPSGIVAKWQSSRCREPLVDYGDMPIAPVTPSFYGTRWRTQSYLHATWPPELILEDGSRVLRLWMVCQPLGIQIGSSSLILSPEAQAAEAKRIICSICPICPQPGEPWQFTNRAEPLTEPEAEQFSLGLTEFPPHGFAVVSVAITAAGELEVMALETD